MALAAASLLVALLAGASPAAAVIVQLGSGKKVSYQPLRARSQARPFEAFFSNLDYNGGPVMASNTNYVIYWQPAGAPAYPPDYQPGVNRYFEDLAHDSGGVQSVESVAAQYNDAEGDFANYSSHFGGALIDTDPYPANGCKQAPKCLTDKQIQEELTKFVKAQGLATDLAHEYFLLTPPGVEDCFQAGGTECSAGSKKPVYCAYHGNIALGAEGQLIYANDPYVTGNGGCDDANHPNGTSDGVIEGGLSHEHNESTTDPEPNSAWADISGGGEENGDKCRTFTEAEYGTPLGQAPNGAAYNQVINGRLYWYQQEWSNQTHECEQRLSYSGPVPTASFTSVPGTGLTMKLDATESTAPGGVVRYNWQFNDGPGHSLSTPEETTGPTTTHTFPKGGTYRVALTVFAADGTSGGTAHYVVTGREGPTAAFSLTGPSPTAGQSAAFAGSAAAAPGLSITAYSWNFGDATAPGTGATPSHIFAAAGTYVVTLTVTDNVGQTAAVSHAVLVAAPPSPGPGGGGTGGGEGAAGSAAGGSGAASAGAAGAPAPIALEPTTAGGVFAALRATLDPKTGAITFTGSVADLGRLQWLLTFRNGRFGVFGAVIARCRKGFVRLNRRCRPSRIVFAKGSKLAPAGVVSFTVRPTASALKALRNAFRHGQGVPVIARFTFQPLRGGSPVSHTQSLTIRLKKKR